MTSPPMFSTSRHKVVFQFQQIAVLGIQLFESLLAFLPIFLKDIQRVIVIVKINQFGVAIHQSLKVVVSSSLMVRGSLSRLLATLVVDDIQRVELVFCELSNGQIDMIRRIKPTAPKPVQIDPEASSWFGKGPPVEGFELPSLGIVIRQSQKVHDQEWSPEDVRMVAGFP